MGAKCQVIFVSKSRVSQVTSPLIMMYDWGAKVVDSNVGEKNSTAV